MAKMRIHHKARTDLDRCCLGFETILRSRILGSITADQVKASRGPRTNSAQVLQGGCERCRDLTTIIYVIYAHGGHLNTVKVSAPRQLTCVY